MFQLCTAMLTFLMMTAELCCRNIQLKNCFGLLSTENCFTNTNVMQPDKNIFFAIDISTVLGYIKCADSKSGLILAELALIFEIYPLH